MTFGGGRRMLHHLSYLIQNKPFPSRINHYPFNQQTTFPAVLSFHCFLFSRMTTVYIAFVYKRLELLDKLKMVAFWDTLHDEHKCLSRRLRTTNLTICFYLTPLSFDWGKEFYFIKFATDYAQFVITCNLFTHDSNWPLRRKGGLGSLNIGGYEESCVQGYNAV
jgi:hypothetical protein